MFKKQAILFVDGYNMIGAWPHLAQHMKNDQLDLARDQLLFELSQYKKMSGYNQIVVVFDAYLVPGITKNFEQFDLTVVFTKEGETADTYIEREISPYLSPVYRLVVATSDSAEQWLVFQKGAYRQSALELLLELDYYRKEVEKHVKNFHYGPYKRRNPWRVDQIVALNHLRRTIEDKSKEES